MDLKTLKIGRPETVGMSYEGLENGFRVLSREVEKGTIPGAVAAIGRRGTIVGFRAYGWAMAYGDKRLMQMDTLFDLASVTKVVATLPLVLRFLDAGVMRLDDDVKLFFPEWSMDGADKVRIRHLLCHTAGLPAHRRFWREGLEGDAIRRAVFETPLETEPGAKVVYSDLGLIILQLIIERLTGADLASVAQKHVFEPLGMKDTMFKPPTGMKPRTAATEYNKELDAFLAGVVHDENARHLGGVAGHAGLFSTAQDLCIYCQMMLNQGHYAGARIISPASVYQSMQLHTPQGEDPRGLGWVRRSAEYSAAGDLLSPNVVFHTGFTGTAIYIDPELELFIVLLTNRVHPTRENESIKRIRPRFCNAVAASIEDWSGFRC